MTITAGACHRARPRGNEWMMDGERRTPHPGISRSRARRGRRTRH